MTERATKRFYSVSGSVRGDCGHKHRSVETAHACFQRDSNYCGRQGGYSDRYNLRAWENGQRVETTHGEEEYWCECGC
jgi:hypothetical protein